jgi:ATP-dependent DNA helicase RecG
MTSDESMALLEEWIQGKEDENCEFKKAENRYDFEELGKYCAAIANEGGGRIILGVTDKRPRVIVGSAAFPQPERTRKGLCESIPLAIDFEEIHHPSCGIGKRVLVFTVPSRPVATPIKYDGRYWMREQDSLVEMSTERLRAILAESGHDFTADTCDGLLISDLDPNAIETFRQLWVAKLERAGDEATAARVKAATHEQLLIDADVLVDGKLANASLILFGTVFSLRHRMANAEIVFEYRTSDSAGPAQERREFQGGFFSVFRELWDAINRRNDKQSFNNGLLVEQIQTFSERVVREALLNAVSHRDYQMGGSVFIRQFPLRLEIDSPGGLPYGITTDNILDRQNPRNRRVAEIFTKCGLCERSGQGMNLIYEELIKQSKPVPDWERTDEHHVGLTIYGTIQDPAFIRFVEQVAKEKGAIFGTRDWIFLAAVARGEKPQTGQERIATRLLDLGVIERGKGRSLILARRYFAMTKQKGTYTRKKGLDREANLALLRQHIEENAETGSKLEELCQVIPALSRSLIQSLLKTLRLRGHAHSVGQTKAGKWYPGKQPMEPPEPQQPEPEQQHPPQNPR